jgi:hypothetical protein
VPKVAHRAAPAAGWEGVRALAEAGRYHRWAVPKARGGSRIIEMPDRQLMAAQRRAARWLAMVLPTTRPSCAFAPGRSVVVHAAAHAGAVEAVQLDIADFFGSVRRGQLIAALSPGPRARAHPMDGWPREAITTLVRLCMRVRDGRWTLPQGAPTSPALANAAAAPLDHRIRAAGNAAFGVGRWTYTRYADDLVISTQEPIRDFAVQAEELARAAIQASGWKVNEQKVGRWTAGAGRPLVICGLLVGRDADPVALGREASRRARAALSDRFNDAMPRREDGGSSASTADESSKEKSRSAAEGTLSWAYTASGDLRWLGPVSARVRELAGRASRSRQGDAQPQGDDEHRERVARAAFVLGWTGVLAPSWALRYARDVLSLGVSPT